MLEAFAAVTFQRNGWFEAVERAAPIDGGARLHFWNGQLVASCRIGARDMPLLLDTGANETLMFSSYYDAVGDEHATWKKVVGRVNGISGAAKLTVYAQPRLDVAVGESEARLHRTLVLAGPFGAYHGSLYGIVGRDVVGQFKTLTIDFAAMRVSLR